MEQFEILEVTRGDPSLPIVRSTKRKKDDGRLDSEAMKVEEKSGPSGWSAYHTAAFQTPENAAKSISEAMNFELPNWTDRYEKVGGHPVAMGGFCDVWKGKMKSEEGARSLHSERNMSQNNTGDVASIQPEREQSTSIQFNHHGETSLSRNDEQSGSSHLHRGQVNPVQYTPLEPALSLFSHQETSKTARQQIPSQSNPQDQISVPSNDGQSRLSCSHSEQAISLEPTPRESVLPLLKSREDNTQLSHKGRYQDFAGYRSFKR
ncbi:hypothetical protein FRC03_007135 [Tulasnella sp. 419]|nr:hypothetical protein FRC03_007135 [Tulasnella sp. 419]